MKSECVHRWLSLGANIAVLAGLVFVGFEVRNGRAAAEAQVADGLADGFLQLNLATINDSSVARIWDLGLFAPDELTDAEAVRFSMYMRGVFNQYQRVFRLYTTGLLDETTWSFTAGEAAWMMETPGGAAHFAVNELPDDFVRAVELHQETPHAADMRLGRPRSR